MARTLRIGLSIIPGDPFWVQVREAAIQHARSLGLELILVNRDDYLQFVTGQTDRDLRDLSDDEQTALVEELLAQDFDALIGWEFPEDLVHRVLEAGLPIIHHTETTVRHPLNVARVGHYQGAQLLGAYVAEQLGGRGHVLVVGGLANRIQLPDDGKSRVAGFYDIFQAYPQITMQHIPTRWLYDHAYPKLYAALQEHAEPIDAIIGLSDPLALAARAAARALGRLGPQTHIAGLGGNIRAFAGIAEGWYLATVENSVTDLGYQLVDLAFQAAQGLPLPAEFACQRRLVTAKNVTEVAAQKLFAMAELPERLVDVQRHSEQQRLSQLETSLKISRQIGAILDRRQLVQEITRQICASYGYDHAQIFLWSEAEQHLVLDQHEADPGQRLYLPLTEPGVLAQAVQRNELVFIPDLHSSPRFPPDPRWPHTRSRVVVPIPLGERLLGVLDLHSERVTKQTRPELVGLQSLAAQLGIAMRNAELYTEALQARARAEEERARAEVANAAKSAFLANMSHELRTPLNGILGYAQILQRRRFEPGVIHGLTTIQQSGEHLLTLINDILDLSKVEAGKLELYPAEVHLPSFLRTIADIIRVRAEKKQLAFRYAAVTALPNGVLADETRLRQVLLNLLDNAVKFTDRGNVTLRVEIRDWRLEIERSPISNLQSPISNLRFEVEDTGSGIPPAQLDTIFAPFEQGGDRAHRFEGSGLGLAISRQLIQLMGGELHVESEVERGSRFWFVVALPVTSDAAETIPPPDRVITGYHGPRRRVLIVDDIVSNRAVLADMLRPIGFELAEAADGRQAVELAQSLRPDLILLDRWMPVLDGLGALRQLRQLPALQGVPIVTVSASVSNEDQALSQQIGFDGFLPKPIHWPRLVALLEAYLQLEWEYEQSGDAAAAARRVGGPLIPPPPEELSDLYQLARLGDMHSLRERAAHLEMLSPRYAPFAHRLRELTLDYQDKAVLALIEPYLDARPSYE